MKKILISLSIIGVVSAVIIGGTIAYFSDTETNTGNTFSAGTIDIDIDGQNPWTKSYDVGDLKPGETGYINFRINNVGQNPVNVSKKIFGFEPLDSGQNYECEGIGMVSSEPECEAEKSGGRVDDVQTQIVYDLSVEVYDSTENKIWWQTIYNEEDGMSIGAVYEGGKYVDLGMIPVGGYMMVTQSYHFNIDAGNEYQGDGLTFNMEIKGEQFINMVEDGGNWCNGADINKDTKVGLGDWGIFRANFGKTGCSASDWCKGADINKDGYVDERDFFIFKKVFGKDGCFSL